MDTFVSMNFRWPSRGVFNITGHCAQKNGDGFSSGVLSQTDKSHLYSMVLQQKYTPPIDTYILSKQGSNPLEGNIMSVGNLKNTGRFPILCLPWQQYNSLLMLGCMEEHIHMGDSSAL